MMGDIEFPADDDMIPDGTEAFVVVRVEDGEIKYREGINKNNKPWRSYPFIVEGGEYDGRYVSLMLTIDPKNFFFRRDVTALTGIDVSGGARVSGEVLEEKLRTGRFRVGLKQSGQYLNIDGIKERFEYEAPENPSIPVGGPSEDNPEEDIPF